MKKNDKSKKKYFYLVILGILVLGAIIYFSVIQASFSNNIIASFRMNDTNGMMLDEHNNINYSTSAIQDGEWFYFSTSNVAQVNDIIPRSNTGSVGFIMKAGATSGLRQVFQIGTSHTNYLRFQVGYHDDALRITEYLDGGTFGLGFSPNIILPDNGDEVHVLIVSNGTSYRAFANGVETATGGSGNWIVNSIAENNHIRFGSLFTGAEGFNGYLKDFVIFDRALTDQEISDYYEFYNISTGYPFLDYYDVTVDSTIGGNVTGNGTYVEGEEVTVIANPDSGYEFIGWDSPFENESEIVIFDISEDVELFANFQIIQTSSGGGSSGGSSSDGTTYQSVDSAYNLTISESEYSVVSLTWWQKLWAWVKGIVNSVGSWLGGLI